jgi:hypothetical protein
MLRFLCKCRDVWRVCGGAFKRDVSALVGWDSGWATEDPLPKISGVTSSIYRDIAYFGKLRDPQFQEKELLNFSRILVQ